MMQQKSLTILAWLALTLSALFAAPAMADDIGGSKKLGLGIAGGYYSNVLTAKYYYSGNEIVDIYRVSC